MFIIYFYRLLILMAIRVLSQSDTKIGEPVAVDADGSTVPTPAPEKPPQPAAKSTPTYTSKSSSGSNLQSSSRSTATKTNWHPIEGLSPYQNNWTIKARVTQKSDLKAYSTKNGEGHLFNVTLMDETGEIRATAFNVVADALYPKFEEGKVYYVSKGKVNLAKKKFSNLQNDYEISLEKNTEVEEVCVYSSCCSLL